ncbi:MAG: DUF1428 family protein [Geminicoccaceae bacterium]|nr:DUF1428 family protein [Geminicoccaceae bacterium]MCB9946055.1 DUF1428 family protein [Geminicoccaceae bacterium]
MAVLCGDGETVVVGWIGWPSKVVRDRAWARMMEDPRLHSNGNPVIHGGLGEIPCAGD